jgi:hypothetical protein
MVYFLSGAPRSGAPDGDRVTATAAGLNVELRKERVEFPPLDGTLPTKLA